MFLTRLSLANRLLVGLVTAAIATLGVFAAGALKQEMMPPTSIPAAYVSVQLEGVAPEEMSRTVTEPLESALQTVAGVKTVTSTTSTGSSDVMVEWAFEGDSEATLQAVKQAAEGMKSSFPSTARLEVFSGSNKEAPSIQISAGSTGNQDTFSTALAQKVAPTLKTIPGVQKVEVGGREEQRIAIDLRPADVARLKVDPTQITQVFEAQGAVLPAGQAPTANGSSSITVGTSITTLEELQNLPVPAENGLVLLKEFADVKAEKLPVGSISRVNGKPSLTLSVTAAQGANIVQISNAVSEKLAELAPGLKAEFVTLFDPAPYIEQSVHDLSVEGGLGLLFAILVVLVFLASWRSTIIAAVSIPLSLLISMIGLLWSGNTLNMLTLGALTIAIGRVVDDSIVVIENINRRAVVDGITVPGIIASVRQVAGAITASTLTTVAVFLPIIFVTGPTGQLFRPFAVTVSVALMASLLVALTIVPVMAYWFLRRGPRKAPANAEAGAGDAAVSGAVATEGADPTAVSAHRDADEIQLPEDKLQRAIMPKLRATWRRPAITVTASVLLLAITLGLTSVIQTDFIGSSGNESLELIQTPGGGAAAENTEEKIGGAPSANAQSAATATPAPLKAADLIAAAEPVEKATLKVDGVKDVIVSIPLGNDETAGPPTISYSMMLESGADSEEVATRVQAVLDKMKKPGEFQLLTKDAFAGGGGGGGGGAIDLQIQGNDPAALKAASELLETKLGKAKGVQSVRSELSGEQSVVRIKLDEARAAKLGFDRAGVAKAIQEAMDGTQIGQLMFEGESRSILMRTPGTQRTADQVGSIVLPVTSQQTAEAQKVASDALQAKAQQEADSAKARGEAEMAKQISDAQAQRKEAVASLGQLREQLTALMKKPLVPIPKPDEPDDLERAENERAEQIAALQGAISGAEASITAADEQVNQLRQSQVEQANQLVEQQKAEAEQKAVQEIRGTGLKISDIAAVEDELVPPMIIRAEGERKVSLTVMPKKGKLGQANASVQAAIAGTELPAGVTFNVGGASQQQDEAFGQLGIAMLVAIMLVLIVMIATFKNFRQPLVLLVSIPFAATGAILGLLITGTPMGLPALIGLLMLVGIVVTNAIVLMDLINKLRADGVPLREAVDHGTRLRLRPILMTAAATIFALVPMSLGLTGGGAFISKPLAIVVIGGLISSTLLTLVLVPIIYSAMERRREARLARREALLEM
ncbi:efflux RND transporter permease subunit [Leucobacter sp. UT-8R-CII-1-4]|uniref:efflux RND transporter permease subunit n=1 Tax=Leucobacter sp. UT-8R-CII-1-4 TaxID=3040075 RepID=UPI0024A7FE75|nr:efflux RND transporter permease subunit [Leucobacter sp. UT-8R-CII-1-4]MDI6024044.1 efflux RND transporter permease subunit [Leucobacter sp. UT-8R-CII-1-4]